MYRGKRPSKVGIVKPLNRTKGSKGKVRAQRCGKGGKEGFKKSR